MSKMLYGCKWLLFWIGCTLLRLKSLLKKSIVHIWISKPGVCQLDDTVFKCCWQVIDIVPANRDNNQTVSYSNSLRMFMIQNSTFLYARPLWNVHIIIQIGESTMWANCSDLMSPDKNCLEMTHRQFPAYCPRYFPLESK